MCFEVEINSINVVRNNEKQQIILSCVKINENLDWNFHDFIRKVLHKDEYQYWLNANEKRRMDFFLGRYSAKLAIQQKISLDLKLINIKKGVFNFPVIMHPHIEYQVSISHKKNFASALLFPVEQPMGIDIENIDRNMEIVIKKQLTDHEIDLINELQISLFIFWTAKESLSKVLKTGLTLEMRILEIKSVVRIKNYFEIKFTYFSQYKSVVWRSDNYFTSITLPKHTSIFV